MARGDTKNRIARATLKMVAQRGFDGVPITAIEEEAGLIPGNGSFYRHFATKEEALQAGVAGEIEKINAEQSQPVRGGPNDADQPSRREAVKRELYRDLEHLRQLRPLILILARDRDRVPAVVASIRETLLESGLLEYSELLGEKSNERAAAIGAVVLTALVGYHLSTEYFGGPPGGIGPDLFVSTLADLVEAGG